MGGCSSTSHFYFRGQGNMKLPDDIQQTVALALAEDIGNGDVTAGLIGEGAQAQATVVCRENAVLCGTAWFDETFRQVDAAVKVGWHYQDGERVPADAVLCSISGNARAMLTAERTALNFLQLLSATATCTSRYVDQVAHTRCKILDTRKTIPGLRTAQKYAVVCGGGTNHRIGLYDRVLIKENHIMAAGSITAAIDRARELHPGLLVEVETETLNELDEALAANADIIMLDDYDRAAMREAVRRAAGRIPLEASGGVSLETVRAIAETGVDFVSVGEITKHIRAIDLSMRFAD